MTSVLMTADTVGGVWTYSLELADALACHGISVSLALMGRPMNCEQRHAVERSAVVEVHENAFALEWMDDPWADVERAGEWLLRLEERLRPDIVHLNGYVHGALPWRAPALVAAHSCVLSWWEAVHGTSAPPQYRYYRERVAAGLAGAAAVVAPTQAMADAVEQWYGRTGVHVVPNCRNANWTRRADKEPLVVAAGRLWDEAKNLVLVDRVAPRLQWPVVVAGGAAHPGGGGDWRGGHSRFLGELSFDELSRLLLRGSVFVLPARYEPFGLGPLEAGLAGCALVLGDIPSLREVWSDAALYVHPDDEDALAAAVGSLIDDPVARRDMQDRARRRARRFSPERTATGYLRVYAALRPGVRRSA